MSPEWPCYSGLICQKTSFLLLLKNSPVYTMYLVRSCECRFILLSDSLDILVRWGAAAVTIVSGDVTDMCWAPNIRDESNTNSEVQYSIIWRISFPRCQISRGLSVNPISGRVTMYIFWWVLSARHFAFRRATVLQLSLRISSRQRGVGNRTSACCDATAQPKKPPWPANSTGQTPPWTATFFAGAATLEIAFGSLPVIPLLLSCNNQPPQRGRQW